MTQLEIHIIESLKLLSPEAKQKAVELLTGKTKKRKNNRWDGFRLNNKFL